MALKRTLTTADYDKLTDEVKKEYKKSGDNYVLDIDGDEDISALKRAKDRETEAAKELREKIKKQDADLKAATDKLAELDDVSAQKRGDIETLTKSWQSKMAAKDTETQQLVAKKNKFIETTLVDQVASALAHKISTAPMIILPHIRNRLSADLEGETPTTKVLDAAGKVSALTLDDLEKEFVANKDFASIISGSKASGSSATTRTPVRSSSATTATDPSKPVDLSKLKPKELTQAIRERKEARAAAQGT